MKREQQVREALRVLAPPPHLRADAKDDIEDALNIIDLQTTGDDAAAKQNTQEVLNRLDKSLRKSQLILRAMDDDRWRFFLDALTKAIADCKKELSRPMRRQGSTAHREKSAVREARDLLRKYDQPVVTTRNKQWHRLSAILCGDLDANLYNQMLRAK